MADIFDIFSGVGEAATSFENTRRALGKARFEREQFAIETQFKREDLELKKRELEQDRTIANLSAWTKLVTTGRKSPMGMELARRMAPRILSSMGITNVDAESLKFLEKEIQGNPGELLPFILTLKDDPDLIEQAVLIYRSHVNRGDGLVEAFPDLLKLGKSAQARKTEERQRAAIGAGATKSRSIDEGLARVSAQRRRVADFEEKAARFKLGAAGASALESVEKGFAKIQRDIKSKVITEGQADLRIKFINGQIYTLLKSSKELRDAMGDDFKITETRKGFIARGMEAASKFFIATGLIRGPARFEGTAVPSPTAPPPAGAEGVIAAEEQEAFREAFGVIRK